MIIKDDHRDLNLKVKNEEVSEVKTKSEWNTLRKRLISAKIREIEDEKIRFELY